MTTLSDGRCEWPVVCFPRPVMLSSLPPDTVHALQGVQALRQWLARHLPRAADDPGSLAGDLFLELADAAARGREFDLDTLAREMPYGRDAIAQQLALMQRQGLVRSPSVDGRAVPQVTPLFHALVERYQSELKTHFIPRQSLRAEQLHLAVADAAVAAQVQALYDRCFDLGWLYLHRFGSTCFMMAMLVHALVGRLGHVAHLQIGYVEVQRGDKTYYLGKVRDPLPGRIEAHAWCVVDGVALIDFGLGNVRRYHASDFPWGVALGQPRPGAEQAVLHLPDGQRARWMADGPAAPMDAIGRELKNCQQVLPHLLAEHDRRFPPG